MAVCKDTGFWMIMITGDEPKPGQAPGLFSTGLIDTRLLAAVLLVIGPAIFPEMQVAMHAHYLTLTDCIKPFSALRFGIMVGNGQTKKYSNLG